MPGNQIKCVYGRNDYNLASCERRTDPQTCFEILQKDRDVLFVKIMVICVTVTRASNIAKATFISPFAAEFCHRKGPSSASEENSLTCN